MTSQESIPSLTNPSTALADPQSEHDTRFISLNSVGISNVTYPVLISGWESSESSSKVVEGLFSMRVSLAADKRGIHMSRLLEGLHHWEEALSPSNISDFLTVMRQEQGAQTASISCKFTWFISRPSPETERPAWQGIETIWHGHQDASGSSSGYTLKIPVTTLCPCSRDISDYGAHSQRGWVKIKLEWKNGESIAPPEEIFEKLQHAGSAPIYPLLKRADERHVTMLAYEQPAFVEDTARRASEILKGDPRVLLFQLDICNEESIHTHDAVASLSVDKTQNH